MHLLKGGGQRKPDYPRGNPQMRVPMLKVDGELLTQSLAIIEYLDETPAAAAASARPRRPR